MLSSSTTPSGIPPLRNMIVPVGTPVPSATAAASVTGWPTTDGFGDVVTVVVDAWTRLTVTAADVLPL